MGKILQEYGGFLAAGIKNRASNTCDMVVVGSTVDCTNISVTRVKNVLGSASTAVGGLCTEALVNKWANFSSREWVINIYPTMANEIKTPYMLGYFAGYNHGAVEPAAANATFIYIKNAGGGIINASVAIRVKMGEYDWGKLGATHCKVITHYPDDMIKSQSGLMPILGAGNFITFDAVSFSFNTNIVGLQSYYTKTWICSSDGSDIASLPTLGSVVCTIYEIVPASLTVRVSNSSSTFVMQGISNESNADYITRTGKYTGNGTTLGKTLNNIVYQLRNKSTGVVDFESIVTIFNVNEYPLQLSSYIVGSDDLEAFSVSSCYNTTARYPIPTAAQNVIITMNYI